MVFILFVNIKIKKTKTNMQEFLDFYFQLSTQPNMMYNAYLVLALYMIWSGRVTNNGLAQAGLTLAAPFAYAFVAIVLGERQEAP